MHCPHCGKEIAPGVNFCPACGQNLNVQQAAYGAATPQPRIVRPRENRMAAGVLAGFAQRYGWDLGLTRVVFCVISFFTFPFGPIAYLIAWVMLPDAQYNLPPYTAPPPSA